MNGNIFILHRERNRRFWTIAIAVLIGLVIFYQHPLYWFFRLLIITSDSYTVANHNSIEHESPEFSIWQFAIFGLIFASVVYAFINPRHFLRKKNKNGKHEIEFFIDNKLIKTYSLVDLSELRIQTKRQNHSSYNKLSKSWFPYFSVSVCIHAVCAREILIYQQRNAWSNKHLAVARKIERFLGEVHWIDNEGILNNRSAKIETIQLAKTRQTQNHNQLSNSKPAVKMFATARVLFAIIFTIFGSAFWFIGDFRVVGFFFFGVAAIILIDLALTRLGFGQRPIK